MMMMGTAAICFDAAYPRASVVDLARRAAPLPFLPLNHEYVEVRAANMYGPVGGVSEGQLRTPIYARTNTRSLVWI